MIDLAYNNACECGNSGCDYDDSLPIGEAQAIADVLVLNSPLLRLVKERNEARELVKRMLAAVDGIGGDKEYYETMLAAHRAVMAWKGGAQ